MELDRDSNLKRYWRAYGGWRAFFTSPYLCTGAILSLITLLLIKDIEPWWAMFLNILPNLLGFSIGAYALLIGLGNEKFLLIIAGDNSSEAKTDSPFLIMGANFIHFILMQLCATLFIIISKILYIPMPACLAEYFSPTATLHNAYLFAEWILNFVTLFFCFYALLLVASASLHLFSMTKWLDIHYGAEKQNMSKSNEQSKERDGCETQGTERTGKHGAD